MLMNRSRTVTTKQALMVDHTSMLSPTKNPSTPISSFLGSPRFFNGFLSKTLLDPETSLMSPTSILDIKNSSSFVNPFGFDRNISKQLPTPSPQINHKLGQEGIGLALIDSINEVKTDCTNFSKPVNRMALFGSKLKVQIPEIAPPFSEESPKSPVDFGIKTRSLSPFPATPSKDLVRQMSLKEMEILKLKVQIPEITPPFSEESPVDFGIKTRPLSPFPATPSKDLVRQMSLKEMEILEDYTCVIIRGPNPKTTHIFDDCVVESCSGDEINIPHREEMECDEGDDIKSLPVDFLSFCHTCKDRLDQDRDIYIYRGDKAFCSHECRCQEMHFEGMKNPEWDDEF